MKTVHVQDVDICNDLPFTLIAGPCAMESRDHALFMARELKAITDEHNVPFIFKSSFDKANRTSNTPNRGIGLEKAMEIFQEIKEEVGCPVITDVHTEEQCEQVSDVVDMLQIPAFLCRQTDLLKAAAATGKAINIKKGQFLAPWDMANVAKKMEDFGNTNIMLCERGASFGYNTLVSDMKSLPIMAKTGYPVIFDATHSVQQPGGQGTSSGGKREFAPILARAALSCGIAGVFAEVHDNPDVAPCDGPNMLKLHEFATILREWVAFDHVAKQNPRTL